MISFNHTKQLPDADLAWQQLHDRLDRDGLLENLPVKKASFQHRVAFRWVAAAVIALSVGLFFILYLTHHNASMPLLAIENKGSDGVLVKTLEDGSIVYLGQHTSLYYPAHFGKHHRKVLLTGNAMFDISRNPTKPFVIQTKKVMVEVLGTAFNVDAPSNGKFSLTVLRGLVKVTDANNEKSMMIAAGETVSKQGSLFNKTMNQDSLIFSRFTSNLRFKDEPLFNIIRVINQISDEPVVLKEKSMQDEKLSVHFYNNNVTSMTHVICVALHLKREIRQDTIFLHR